MHPELPIPKIYLQSLTLLGKYGKSCKGECHTDIGCPFDISGMSELSLCIPVLAERTLKYRKIENV